MSNWHKPAASWKGQTWAERAIMSIRYLTIQGILSESERDRALNRLQKMLVKDKEDSDAQA